MSGPIKASEVISYLNDNPDFFMQYPELAASLKVASKNGQLTSLVNHQVNVLQEKNRALNLRLHSLIENARDNQAMMDRLFDLLNALSLHADLAAYIEGYQQFIRAQFKSDVFQLLLSDEALQDIGGVRPMDAEIRTQFSAVTEHNKTISGRLSAEKCALLFGRTERAVASAIVLPLGDSAAHGLMAFGSHTEDTFHPELSSDILQKLAEILARKLDTQAQHVDQKAG